MKDIPKEKLWKYAKCEIERCFLLGSKPALQANRGFKEITDKYLYQTNIRLRKTFDGQAFLYKLTKKLPLKTEETEIQWVSTIYLSKAEYETFVILPGDIIEKKRFYYQVDSGEIIGIDEVLINGEYTWIAEVEFESLERMNQYRFPLEYLKEVTNDILYAGNELAKRYHHL